MIRNLRSLWARTQAKRGMGTIQIRHVRSNVNIPGNELADAVASAAMQNANELKRAAASGGKYKPTLIDVNMDWARATMRAQVGSDRLHPPPPSTHPSTPSSTSSSNFPRRGDG